MRTGTRCGAACAAGLALASALALARAGDGAAEAARLADTNDSFVTEAGSRPREFTRVGELVFFVAETPATGRELFVTDGSETGTRLVVDLVPGARGSSPAGLVADGGFAWFEAETALRGRGGWRSDGTAAGTLPVTALPLPEGPPPPVPGSRAVRDLILYADEAPGLGIELFRSDGTTQGTHLLADLRPGAPSSFPGQFTLVGGLSLFTALGAEGGFALWRTDGTEQGTVELSPSDPWVVLEGIRHLASLDDRLLLFSARDDEHGSELWRSDGTAAGTFLVRDLAAGPVHGSDPHDIRDVGDGLAYFAATTPEVGLEPWRTDGTAVGTRLLADVSDARPDGHPADVVVAGPRALFSAVSPTPHSADRRIWTSDGTAAGTEPLPYADLVVVPPEALPVRAPRHLACIGDDVLGIAFRDTLFVARGPSGPGERVVLPQLAGAFLTEAPPIPLGDRALLRVDAPVGALLYRELWITDGTVEGTTRVAGSSVPRAGEDDVARLGDAVYLGFSDAAIQRTDGTPEGTSWIRMPDSAPWTTGSVAAAGRRVLFVARNPSTGLRAVAAYDPADGSLAVLDTLDVREFRDASGLPARSLWGVGPTALFARRGADELWKTDGTLAGTARVADVRPGWGSAAPLSDVAPVRVGRRVLFAALSEEHGLELWAVEDDRLGATLVADVAPGPADSRPHALVPLGSSGHAVFAASDGVHGTEPWITDGTPEGTHLLADVRPGTGSSNPHAFAVVGTRLVFAADGDEAGAEPWSVSLTGLGLDPAAFDGSDGFVSERGPAGVSPERLDLERLRVKLNFRRTSRDEVKVRGTFVLPPGFEPEGARVVAQVAGLTEVFVLDADGRAESGRNRLRIRVPGEPGAARFDLEIAGRLQPAFAASGLTRDRGRGRIDVAVRVSLLLDATTRGQDADLRYRVRRRKGKAKLAR